MLRFMRSGILSGLFLLILLFAGIGLVLTDWNGFFRDGISSNDVAEIDGDAIKSVSFDRMLRTTLRAQQIPVESAYKLGIVNQVLNNEINRLILYKEATRLGIIIPDQAIAEEIKRAIAPLTSQGMDPKDALDRLQQSTGLTEQGLVHTVRQDMTVRLLSSAIEDTPLAVPSSLADDVAQIAGQTRRISLIKLQDKDAQVEAPSEDDLKGFYEQKSARYAIPESRDVTVLIIDMNRLKQSVSVSDEEVKAAYEAHPELYSKQETRTVEQALLRDEDTANKVAETFRAGGTLEGAVEKVTGAKTGYVGREDFEKDGLLEDIAAELFTPPAGTIVGPVKSPLGWHVFKVVGVNPPHQQPFDAVKASIRTTLEKEAQGDELMQMADDLDNEVAGGADIAALTEAFPVTPVVLKDVTRLGAAPVEDIPAEDLRSISDEIFSLFEGEGTPVAELSDGRYYTAIVTKIVPETVPPLEDIRTRVKADWLKVNKQIANFKQAQTDLEALQKGKSTLGDLAKTHEVSLQTVTVKAGDTPPAEIAPQAFTQFFTAKLDTPLLLPALNGLVLGKVTDIQYPDPAMMDESEKTQSADEIQRGFQQGILAGYLQDLRNRYNVKVNDELLEQTYGEKDDENSY